MLSDFDAPQENSDINDVSISAQLIDDFLHTEDLYSLQRAIHQHHLGPNHLLDGYYPLLIECISRNIPQFVEYLLLLPQTDVNLASPSGYTPLMAAMKKGI